MAGAHGEQPGFGDLIDEIKLGTDHEIALASDQYQGIVGSARRALNAQLGQSSGEADLLTSRMRFAIDDNLDQSAGMQRALINQASRSITSQILGAQGAANLFGLPPLSPADLNQALLASRGPAVAPPISPIDGGMSGSGGCPPGTEPTGSPILEWDPVTHKPVYGAQGCMVSGDGTEQPTAGIQNIQGPVAYGILEQQPCECPPPQECPIPPGMIPFDIWARHCKEKKDKCFYLVPFGRGPLSPEDKIIAQEVPCDFTLLNIWEQEKYYCPRVPLGAMDCTKVPPPPPPPPPPGLLLNQQCPPPNQIINVPQPQPGGPGIIINEFPPGTIINEPTPTEPIPPPGGYQSPNQIVNIQIAPNQGPQGNHVVAALKPTPQANVPDPAAKLCQDWDNWAAQFQGQTPLQVLQSENILDQQGNLSALTNLFSGNGWPPAFQWVPKWIGAFIQLPFVVFILAWAKTLQAIQTAFCENPAAMVATAVYRGALTWVGRFLGAKSRQADTGVMKRENYLCPSETPSVGEANLARMRGDIDEQLWKCWVRMANLHETYAEKIYYSERELLSPFDLGRAWLRKYISDDSYNAALFERGILNEQDRALAKKLNEFLPPVSDVLHFIVRGIGDPQIVQRFQLLEEFDVLYTGDLVTWGEAAGVSKKTMEAYHAAHWIVPSPGQLFQMLQRLRPDNLPEGADQSQWSVTDDDVNRALRENAYAPFWRPRLQAIAYNPIPRNTLIQLYQIGKLDDDQLVDKFRDLGYTATDAAAISASYKPKALKVVRSEEWIKWYEESAVTRQDAGDQLVGLGYAPNLVNQALDYADDVADAKTRIDCLKQLERNFATGGMSALEAQQVLMGAGLDPRQVTRLLVQWGCRQQARTKPVLASTVCKWYAAGLITVQEFAARLTRLNYSAFDVTRIVAECVATTDQKRLIARQKAIRQSQLDLIRQEKAGAYQQKEKELGLAAESKATAKGLALQAKAEATLLRARAKLETVETRATASAIRKAESVLKAEERIESRVQSAAEKFAARAGISSVDTSNWILDAWSNLQKTYGLDSTTTLEAAILAAGDKRAVDQASYASLADLAGRAAQAIETAGSGPASSKPGDTLPGTTPPDNVP